MRYIDKDQLHRSVTEYYHERDKTNDRRKLFFGIMTFVSLILGGIIHVHYNALLGDFTLWLWGGSVAVFGVGSMIMRMVSDDDEIDVEDFKH